MAKLESLTVRGFKSIRSLEDFKPGQLNVLIGANGAGKSNFIDLFHMLARLVEKRLQVFVAEQGGPDALLFGGIKRTNGIEAELSFGSNGYRFSLVPTGDHFIFGREETRFFGDWSTPTHFLGSGYDESKLKDVDETGEDSFAPYVRTAIAGWRVYHFHDTSTTAPVRQPQAVRDNLLLKPDAGNLGPFLRHLREQYPEHYQQIIETVRLAAPFFGETNYRRDTHERMELEWFHTNDPDNTVLGPRQLSDGTLRFICLATLLLQPVQLQPDLILIDEPELGLHPSALTLLAEMLQQASDSRQLIVSTQSADLVNQLEPEDIVVVDRKDGASCFERLDRDNLKDWLEDYALGDLWKMNIFGGRPGR
ncbi:MAG: AAA family ATPase [Gammaproteobacteria bacterium]|nr:AAA family ATPase [Gammaproteobacteria bacterium]MDE0283658.1 AAA family ATPase [Gammaproteobacteria bacterium]